MAASVLAALGPSLRRWDRRAAATADRYLVNSHAVRRRVERLYGIEAEVVPPPVSIDTNGPVNPIDGIDTGFVLCVSRLLGYKNVSAVIEAFGRLADERLVVVGAGPLAGQLSATAPSNVTFVGAVDDATLRWLYRASSALVSASYEDFGMTPIEANSYGKPVAVLRWGGFLDTLVEGETGEYVERPEPAAVVDAIRRLRAGSWDEATLQAHAARYAPICFAARMREIVVQERARL
jgi:glycosyltransferase involved in cell wall biosynthesis